MLANMIGTAMPYVLGISIAVLVLNYWCNRDDDE